MELPIEEADYWVKYMILPPRIYAFVHSNGDGTFLIFLDPRRSRDQQIDSYIHELLHIIRGDLYSDLPVQVLEMI